MRKLVASLAPCVADLGARGGLDEDMLPIAWASHAVGFEPDPEEAGRLRSAGDARWNKVSILPYAVGGTSGDAVLHVPESSEGASLLAHDGSMAELYGYDNLHIDKKEIPVTVHTLDELRAKGELPRVDYLKIDIEGAELDVLKAGEATLRDCVALKVECSFLPQRLRQPLIWEVGQYLVTQDFWAMDIRDIRRWRRRNLPSHPYRIAFTMPYSRGQLAQCDLIFLRSPQHIADDAQALRLIVLSAVLGYYDHAITVMRMHHTAANWAADQSNVNLELELSGWSERAGRAATAAAIKHSLRGLVPLLRSKLNHLPYPPPRRPY